jgi:hypothetical protein
LKRRLFDMLLVHWKKPDTGTAVDGEYLTIDVAARI